MPPKKYDQIIVTGCSHSCGTEMNDGILDQSKTLKEREANIIKWGKQNLNLPYTDIAEIKKHCNQQWLENERQKSWPATLHTILDVPVINLAMVGASVGKMLLNYSAYLNDAWQDQRTAVIHQIPATGRMCMKFDDKHGRVDIHPGNIENFGFKKDYFAKQIESVQKLYKKRISDEKYLRNYQRKVIGRMSRLSKDRGITEFYIYSTPEDVNSHDVIADNFNKFKDQYTKGTFGHVNDPKFNGDLCKLIIPYLC